MAVKGLIGNDVNKGVVVVVFFFFLLFFLGGGGGVFSCSGTSHLTH